MALSIVARVYAYISSAWVQLDDIMPANVSWGINGGEWNDRVADVGELTVTLNNSTGLYSPDGDNALAGWKKGLPFKLVVSFENEDFVRFRGVISEISIRPGNRDKKAYITVLDWLDYATRHPIVNPGILTDQRGDEVIDTVLAEMGINPQATELGTGYETFPTVFDKVTSKTTAYSEFAKVAASELGQVYLTKDRTNGETLVFKPSSATHGWKSVDTQSLTTEEVDPNPGFLLMETGDYLLLEDGGKIILDEVITTNYSFDGTLGDDSIVDISMHYGKNIKNKMTVSAHPRRLLTESAPKTIELDIDSTVQLANDTPDSNYPDGTAFGVGEYNAGTSIVRTWIKPTFKRLPSSGIKFISAKLRLVPLIDQSDNTRTLYAHRCLRETVHTGATWYEYSQTDNFWGTAGCSNSSTDYDGATPLGSLSISSAPTIGAPVELEFTAAGVVELQKMYDGTYTNNGVILFMETQDNDQIYFAGVNNSTPGYKPVIILTYYRDVLFSLDKEIIIGAGETITIKGTYSDPDSGIAISAQEMITPVATTDYTMFTETEGGGTNTTSDIVLGTIAYGSEGFTHQVTNSGDRVGFINRYSCRGVGIITPNPIEYSTTDSDSAAEYGYETDTLAQKYKNNLYGGRVFVDSVVEENKNPRTVLESISFVANKSEACLLAFLLGDVGQLYSITISEAGVSGNYYIQGIEFNINGGIVRCKWIVKLALSLLSGLTPIAVEFDGGTTDGINFGYLPKVSNLTTRSWSAWIYMDDDPATKEYIYGAISAAAADLGASEYGSGYSISAYTGRKIEFTQAHTGASSADGIWRTPTNSIPLTTWTHILITHDITTPTTAPIIYINGTAQTLTTVQTPVGSVSAEDGNGLVIGNNKSTLYNYNSAFDGKIFDPRIYSDVKTSGNATTLYNSGTPDETLLTSGLMFQGFCVRTSDLDAYTDITLTSSLNVRDNLFGAVGSPNGTPTARAAP